MVIVLENSFLFAADLVREISRPVVCHFVRSDARDVKLGGHHYREIFFSAPPALRGRDVLVVDAVLNTGITQDFLIKRLEEGRPRSLRLAVLFDKPASRQVDLQAEYTGFAAASKDWVGYGLSDDRRAVSEFVVCSGERPAVERPEAPYGCWQEGVQTVR